LPGYADWQKRVNIAATMTTEFRSIRLFPTTLPQTSLLNQVAQFALSPNSQLIAVLHTDQTIEVIDPQKQSVVPAAKLNFVPTNILWSPDNNNLLIWSNKSAAVLALGSGAVQVLHLPNYQTNSFAWDPRLPNHLFYLSTTNELHSLTVNTNQNIILLNPISAFTAVSNGLIAATPAGDLSYYDFSGQLMHQLTNNINHRVIKIAAIDSQTAVIQLADQSLVLSSPNGTRTLAAGVSDFAWSPDNTLLYIKTSPEEISVYDHSNDQLPFMEPGTLKLVARLSQPVQYVTWFPDNQHLIYQINDQIIVSEIDTRDHAITQQLDTTDLGSPQPQVTTDGKVMYYLKKINAATSLIAGQLILPN
jgi:hypothetical protein